jgi:DNA polymerase-3 subunit delta
MPVLGFDALLRAIKKADVRPTYYFFGDEDLLKDDAVRGLIAAGVDQATRELNVDRRRAADLAAEDFRALVLTPPMLASRRAVVLSEVESLRQRRPRQEALREALLSYLAGPVEETLLVLVQSAGEKEDPDLSRLATTVEFERLPPGRVGKWLRHRAQQEGLELDEEAVTLLLAAAGDDLPLLAAELAKLKAAVGARRATREDVEELVGVRHGETVWDLVDAVLSRRFTEAADKVEVLLFTPGSSGVRLLMSLGAALTGLALVHSLMEAGASPSEAAERALKTLFETRPMGLRDWKTETRRWAEESREWTASDLDAALSELLRADRRLKGTSLSGEGDIVREAILAMGAARVGA